MIDCPKCGAGVPVPSLGQIVCPRCFMVLD